VSNKRRSAAEPSAVTLAYVHSEQVAHSWHQSLLALIGWDLAHDARVARGRLLAMRCGTDGLPAARNKAVRAFLADTDSEWLLWIDTDMGFDPDMLDRLLAAADPVERPIVGALCFAQREMAPDGVGGFVCRSAPTIYDWRVAGDRQGFSARRVYEPDALTRCGGTGSAAIVIHRTVFEKIAAEMGATWYNRAPEAMPDEDGTVKMMGEDLSFCMRSGVAGFPVHVHAGIKTTHLKPVWLSEDDYLQQYTIEQIMAAPDGHDAASDMIDAAEATSA
jgi:hypothetical protein